ncbi:MAG: P-loop NTPase fold protein [Candidatus Hodarchaeales archaeon]
MKIHHREIILGIRWLRAAVTRLLHKQHTSSRSLPLQQKESDYMMNADTPRIFDNDEATLRDRLERTEYAKALARLAIECRPPFVVGLYGTWGAGKTSLMKLIRAELDKSRARSVWFDPWQHQFDESPVMAMMHAMVDQLDLQEQGSKLLTVIAGAFGSVLLKATTNLTIKDIDELATRFEEERFEVRDARVRLRQNFKNIIALARGEDSKRIIFFLDDLDRCMPSTILGMLESLKLYLNLPGCVYFLGVDRQALEQGVRHQYKDIPTNEVSYLDKIIQLPFTIPPIAPETINTFIKPLLKDELSDCRDLLVQGLSGNPRQIKRFINTLSLNHQLAIDRKIQNYNPLLLALMLYIQYRNPALYQIVAKRPDVLQAAKRKYESAKRAEETKEDEETEDNDEHATMAFRYIYEDFQLREILKMVDLPSTASLWSYIYLTQVAGLGEVAREELATEKEAVSKYAVLRFNLHPLIEHSEILYSLRGISSLDEGIIKCDPLILEELRGYDSELLIQESLEEKQFRRDLKRIGGKLWELLFDRNPAILKSFYKLIGAAGGIERTSLEFVVNSDTSKLALESLLYEGQEFWILYAPMYRTLGLSFETRPFVIGVKSAMPINCLIIEAPTEGYVPEVGLSVERCPLIEQESRQIQEFMMNKSREFNIGQVRRIAGEPGRRFAELIAKTLEEERWDVVHYAGMHVCPGKAREAYMLLPDEKGISLLSVEKLTYLLRHSGTSFVYLGASGRAGGDVVFQYARYGIPAVLGFRADVPDMMALQHAESFYRNLFIDRVLGAALHSTRRELYKNNPNDYTWASSVLYMQSGSASTENGTEAQGR